MFHTFDAPRPLRWEESMVPPQRTVFGALAGFGLIAVLVVAVSHGRNAMLDQKSLIVSLCVVMAVAAVATAVIDMVLRRFGARRSVTFDFAAGRVTEEMRLMFGPMRARDLALAEVVGCAVVRDERSMEDPEYAVWAEIGDGSRLLLQRYRSRPVAEGEADALKARLGL